MLAEVKEESRVEVDGGNENEKVGERKREGREKDTERRLRHADSSATGPIGR